MKMVYVKIVYQYQQMHKRRLLAADLTVNVVHRGGCWILPWWSVGEWK